MPQTPPPARYAVLGTPGRVRAPARLDPATLLAVLGANAGNLVFQYATARIVDAPLTFLGLADTPYSDRSAIDGAAALIFPAANHLRAGADWTGLNAYLEGAGKPLVVLGLGAQAPAGASVAQTVEALRGEAHVRRMLDILRERAVLVTVRGAFSQAVCADLGLTDTLPLGCPSALLSPDPQLGQTIAARLAALRSQPRPRLAMTAAAPFEIALDAPRRALERQLFAWMQEGAGLYVQQSGGVAAMQAASGQWHRISEADRGSIAWVLADQGDPAAVWDHLGAHGRFFTSAADWIAAMAPLDLVLGSRAHGAMAALAAGTPGVLIHHDLRTSELAETMHLPTLDAAAVTQATRLQDALPHIRFDAAAFDAWRGATARDLATAFDRIGLPFAPTVRALAAPNPAKP